LTIKPGGGASPDFDEEGRRTPMCLNILEDSRLYVMLLKCDADLAAIARAPGCSCGGALHSARYPAFRE